MRCQSLRGGEPAALSGPKPLKQLRAEVGFDCPRAPSVMGSCGALFQNGSGP